MIREMDILEYLKDRRDGDVVVDFRSETMYAFGTIPGAINIPVERVGVLYELPSDKPIYLFCQVGEISGQFAELLSDAGYNAYNLAGGYREYFKHNLKVGEENGIYPEGGLITEYLNQMRALKRTGKCFVPNATLQKRTAKRKS